MKKSCMRSPFNRATETIYPIDFYMGEIFFEDAVKLIAKDVMAYDEQFDSVKEHINELVNKIEFALDFTLLEYGAVREYHLFFIPAFMTDEPTGDSELIVVVKAKNNGTTLVFSESWVVPRENEQKTWQFIKGGYLYA